MDRREQRPNLGVAGWLGIGWIALLVALAILEPVLPLRDPAAKGIRTGDVARFESPGWNAWFGGGSQGEDLFARVIAGIRPALVLGVTVTVVAALAGGLIGATSALRRGRFDAVTTFLVDAALAFPALVLLIASRSAFGNSMTVLIVVFTLAGIGPYARIIRGATLGLADREFVVAARSMGATRRRILLHELAPNLAMPLLSVACLGFAVVILTEGALSYLGLSMRRTTWGAMIAAGTGEIRKHPHVALIPATVMFVTVLAFNLVGDAVQRVVSPRSVVTARRAGRTAVACAPMPDGAVPDGRARPVLEVRNLRTVLHTDEGDVVAVDDVSFDVHEGELLALVGESGSGKTMILRSIVGAYALADVTRSGRVALASRAAANGAVVDMINGPRKVVQAALGHEVGMVAQNPLTALNPVRRVGVQVAEPMRVHGRVHRRAARRRAIELLDRVGIADPRQRVDAYPHQLSGGMRQRVTVAVALANRPALLLADEPTTALDVTVQEQLVTLLAGLQREHGMAMIFVTHNLALARDIAGTIAVVYAGQVVELASAGELFERPMHRYTAALLAAIPDPLTPSHTPLVPIEGSPPSLADLPAGCRFAPRCPAATQQCRTDAPPLLAVVGVPAHLHRCWHPAGGPG